MKNLRPVGLILLILGIFFFAINYSMVESGGFYLSKLFPASIIMFFLGLAVTICKGADLSPDEVALLNDPENKIKFRSMSRNKAPSNHKVVRVVFTVIGLVLSFTVEDRVPVLINIFAA